MFPRMKHVEIFMESGDWFHCDSSIWVPADSRESVISPNSRLSSDWFRGRQLSQVVSVYPRTHSVPITNTVWTHRVSSSSECDLRVHSGGWMRILASGPNQLSNKPSVLLISQLSRPPCTSFLSVQWWHLSRRSGLTSTNPAPAIPAATVVKGKAEHEGGASALSGSRARG